MNTIVIVLLGLAFCIHVVALGIQRSPQVEHQGDGLYEVEFYERRHLWSNILTTVGLVMATAAGLLSVLSSGG